MLDISEDELPSFSDVLCVDSYNLLKKFHRVAFAHYDDITELIDQFDFLCGQWLERLGCTVDTSFTGVNKYYEWLLEERFAWKLALHVCTKWQKKRVLRDKDQISLQSGDFENHLMSEDSFCELLEKDYEKTADAISSTYSYMFNQACDWPETLFKAKKPKFADNCLVRMDPDAPFTCGPLAASDQIVDDKLLVVAFALLRCGKTKEAIQLFESIGQHWRATPLLIEGICESEEDIELWDMTNTKLAFQEQLNPYERAINGILSGQIEPVWAVCKDINDYWWAAAKCHSRKSGQERAARQNSLRNVFNIVHDKAPLEISQRSRMPIRLLHQLLVLEEIEDGIEVLRSSIENWTNSDGFQFDLYRFAVHMAIVLRQCAPNMFLKHKQDRIDEILVEFSKYIAKENSVAMLCTSYISFVRNVRLRRDGLTSVIEAMPDIESKIQLVESSLRLLNVEDVMESVVWILKGKRSQMRLDFDSFGYQVLSEDNLKELDLLGLLPGASEHMLHHGNALCRACISMDDSDGLKHLIDRIEAYEGWYKSKVSALLDEHEDVVEYATFKNALNRWLAVSSCSPDEDNNSRVNDNCKLIAEEIQKSASRILNQNWMLLARLKYSDDKSRNEQIQLIRSNCLPTVMTTTIAILEKSQMLDELCEFVQTHMGNPLNSSIKTLSIEQVEMITESISEASINSTIVNRQWINDNE